MSKICLPSCRSVEEIIKVNPHKVLQVNVCGELSDREEELLSLIKKNKIRINHSKKSAIKSGLEIELHDYKYTELGAALENAKNNCVKGKQPVVICLDGIVDPHNLGAIARTAAFIGVSAIIITADRAVQVNDTVYRIASGGLEHVDVVRVTNLASAIESSKKAGFWAIGFTEKASDLLHNLKADAPLMLVIGNEEKGIRDRTVQVCDIIAKIQPAGDFSTLNASVAAALAMSWAKGFPHLAP